MNSRLHDGSVRFGLPSVTVVSELDWLLAWAFGNGPPSQAPGAFDVGLAIELGERFDLLPRLCSRMPPEVLNSEVDETLVRSMDRARHAAAAIGLRNEIVTKAVADIADDLKIRVVFLKGMALELLGLVQAEARLTSDIDVLVENSGAERLQEDLIGRGCKLLGFPGTEQHLPSVVHPLGSTIELHFRLGGVRLEGGQPATLENCADLGLLRFVPIAEGSCLVPTEQLLLAHLVVHALGQHGKISGSYPAFRLLGDLQDLGYSPAGGGVISRQSMGWIDSRVSGREVDATLDLLGRLERGELASDIEAEECDAAMVIRHIVSSALDSDYQQSLMLERWILTVSDRPRIRRLATHCWRAIWLTPAQIDLIYGKPESRFGYVRWRLWRPLDLVHRSLRAALAWWRLWRRPRRRCRDNAMSQR